MGWIPVEGWFFRSKTGALDPVGPLLAVSVPKGLGNHLFKASGQKTLNNLKITYYTRRLTWVYVGRLDNDGPVYFLANCPDLGYIVGVLLETICYRSSRSAVLRIGR